MTSEVSWQIEYATIGDVPQTAAPRNRSCPVLIGSFGVASTKPLTEQDPGTAVRLARDRTRPAAAVDTTVTVRKLRLSAGLSQTKLARLAGTTQPYVARLEAGSLDPGTDKLARLAAALSVSPVALFNAVRAQRAISL
jgi:ribosome-binding protein aMBF1 (putative translation factor)